MLLDEPFRVVFERAGYALTYDSKGRHYEGMWKLMGGDLEVVRFLRDEHNLRLLSKAQVRKGRAFTYRELFGIAQPGSDACTRRFADQMGALVERHIWLRGYNLKCAVCGLEAWYDLSAVVTGLCQGCLSPLRLPLEVPFAYRLNPLFVEGLKQGALTVLLTILRLTEESDSRIVWRAGCEVRKGGVKTDLDLVVWDGSLKLVECKDHFPATEMEVKKLIAQLERSLTVAGEVNARFVFAILRETIPQAVIDVLNTAGARGITRRDLLQYGP